MNAIIVCAWNRPKYLSVCLQSLVRCHRFKEWKLFISLDGGGITDLTDYAFCKARWIVRPDHMGNRKHVISIFQEAVELGVSNLLFVEEDHMVMRPALVYALRNIGKAPIVSFHTHPTTTLDYAFISDSPNVFTRWVLINFLNYYRSGEWHEHLNTLKGNEPLGEIAAYDHIMYAWSLREQVCNRYAECHYSLNFGVNGVNYKDKHALEDEMFSGADAGWRDNIRRLSRRADVADSFRPNGNLLCSDE